MDRLNRYLRHSSRKVNFLSEPDADDVVWRLIRDVEEAPTKFGWGPNRSVLAFSLPIKTRYCTRLQSTSRIEDPVNTLIHFLYSTLQKTATMAAQEKVSVYSLAGMFRRLNLSWKVPKTKRLYSRPQKYN